MFQREEAVIVDVDGTLVDVSGIRHHVIPMDAEGNYKSRDFDAFHTDAINCPPIVETLNQVRSYHNDGKKILIVTARSQRYGRQTAFWLAMHDVPSDAMYMRPDKDMRKDVLVKRDLLARIRHRYIPIHAIDDNPNVIELWDEEKIPFTVVPGYEG